MYKPISVTAMTPNDAIQIKAQTVVAWTHGISTARKEKAGSGLVFSLIEPNWPLPCSTVPVPRLRDARLAGWVTYCSICASTMPRAQNRAGKGSILVWRRLTFPIFLLFIHAWTILEYRVAWVGVWYHGRIKIWSGKGGWLVLRQVAGVYCERSGTVLVRYRSHMRDSRLEI